MGWVKEIIDLLEQLRFHNIVHEYQQALYFRAGTVIERKVKWGNNPSDKKKLEEIIAEEKEVIKSAGGESHFIFERPQIPEGFYRSRITGLPVSKKRFDKILRAGWYFKLPILDNIVIDDVQESILNLGDIQVPTNETDIKDSKVVLLSCNLRYEVRNFYKSYTAVNDYKASLKDHTMSILAKHSRGKSYADWINLSKITELETEVIKELRKIVTDKWGLQIHNVYITNNAQCTLQKVSYEGQPLLSTNLQPNIINGNGQSEN